MVAAINRKRELVQRPNPPEPVENIQGIVEDVAAAMDAFSTTLAIKKQQRKERQHKVH